MGKTYLKSKKRTQKIKKKRRTNVKMKRKYIRSKRKKRTIRKKRNITKKKIMRGGMEQDLTSSARVPPEGPCKKQKPTLRTWPDRYLKISGNSLLVFNKEGDTIPRRSSILNLTGCQITQHIESFTFGSSLYAIKIKRDTGLEKTDVTEAKFAFPTLELRGKFFDALTNISAGREWNVSEEEQRTLDVAAQGPTKSKVQVSTQDVKNEGVYKKTAKPESQRYIERMIEILNKYSGDFTIDDIFSFSNGLFGLAISVNARDKRSGGEQKLIIKIMYGNYEDDLKEFEIQKKVNEIDENISPLVYGKREILSDKREDEESLLPNIVMLLSRCEGPITTKAGIEIAKPIIPRHWSGAGGLVIKPNSTEGYTIVVMQYVDGINLKIATVNNDILEDLRIKINLLHDNGIYHCDLHPDNLLVDGNTVKIIDFGFAVEKTGKNHWIETIPCPDYGHPDRNKLLLLINDKCGNDGTESCID